MDSAGPFAVVNLTFICRASPLVLGNFFLFGGSGFWYFRKTEKGLCRCHLRWLTKHSHSVVELICIKANRRRNGRQ